MKVKIIAPHHCESVYDDEYKYYGLIKGKIYQVLTIYDEVSRLVVINDFGIPVMLFSDEVKEV